MDNEKEDKKGKNITLKFLPDKKKVKFSSKWLEANAYDKKSNNSKIWINPDLKVYYSPDLFIYHRERRLNGFLLQRMCFGMDFLNLIKPNSGIKGFQPILPSLIFLTMLSHANRSTGYFFSLYPSSSSRALSNPAL